MDFISQGLSGAAGRAVSGAVGSAKAAQSFLNERVDAIKKMVTTGEGLENIAWAKAHPVLGATNAISKATGGPSLEDGFRQGVTVYENGPEMGAQSNDYELRFPPMPF